MTINETTAPVEAVHHSTMARWAVGLAAGAVTTMGVAMAELATVMLSDSPDALDDNSAGWFVVSLFFGGLGTSLVAMAMALAAKARREQWHWLWLPLALFPAMLVFLVLGEAFWWE